MTHLGEHWAGVCLNDQYTLRRYLGEAEDSDGDAAFFEGEDSSGSAVLMEVLEAGAEGSRRRFEMWRRTAYLDHPNLLRLLRCGEGEGPSTGDCFYAVFERPDESLAAALEQGPLSERDAREVLVAGLDALRYLHAQGLVHGAIGARSVLALGNRIKLATADLHEPGEPFPGRDGTFGGPASIQSSTWSNCVTGEAFTYGADIAALGALVYRVLTGSEFGRGADFSGIAEGMATIIRNTAGAAPADRWRIPEVLAYLPAEEPPAPEPVAAAAQPEPEPVGPTIAAPPQVAEVPEMVAPAPSVDETRAYRADHIVSPAIPRWAWPVSVAAIIGCIAWVVHTPARNATAPVPRAPAFSAPHSQPQTAPPRTVAPAVRETAPPPPVRASATQERSVWRVIAYTYNAFHDAQKRVTAINQKWPGLGAEVFAPKGKSHPPYLVALGGRMNRMDAARVLQKARSRGLPRDTFILNFSD